MKKLFLLMLAVFILPALSIAAPPESSHAAAPPSASAPALDRKTNLSFDNDVVEGMNGAGLDSAENIGTEDGGGHHLYHKRKNFNKEMPVLIHEMGFSE